MKQLARKLRVEQTDAEHKLWNYLRNRQISNLKFRRQHVIGSYIMDFCCIEKKLVIEVDGGHHAEGKQLLKDEKRTAYLVQMGYQVLRFWDHEVLPNPLPKGRGKKGDFLLSTEAIAEGLFRDRFEEGEAI
ncbi:MAG: endonuclease domain-containing protein [Candidatus Omnitrophica bacterium]|nr:endonuclease domain-containing protein [Candidatus Omnitrophota bacterium]